MGFGNACAGRLRHALGFAGQIHRRCVINQEPAVRVAADLGLDHVQTTRAVQLLRKTPLPPSRERLALVAMLDPGLDDADIAEIFGGTVAWAASVRERGDELRLIEPLPTRAERGAGGLRPDDPTPEELQDRCREVRARRTHEPPCLTPRSVRCREFSWDGYAFFSVGAG